jgi:hypothetical protein
VETEVIHQLPHNNCQTVADKYLRRNCSTCGEDDTMINGEFEIHTGIVV